MHTAFDARRLNGAPVGRQGTGGLTPHGSHCRNRTPWITLSQTRRCEAAAYILHNPLDPSQPGTRMEEVPDGRRTIAATATSITAFIGRARRGPTDRSRLVQCFAQFDRVYGGLWFESPMSYAVQHYFLNGGQNALIARVHHGAAAATLTLPGAFELVAANEGDWGNYLRVRVEYAASEPGEAQDSRFSLSVKDTRTGLVERFVNLSTDVTHKRYVTGVLADESDLVRNATPETVAAATPVANGAAPAGSDALEDGASSWAFDTNGDDGSLILDDDISDAGLAEGRRGLWMLEHEDLFNLLCIPPLSRDRDVGITTWDAAVAYAKLRRAMVIVDPPADWNDPADVNNGLAELVTRDENAALYFPRVLAADPLSDERLATFAPCGFVAGIYARTDAQHGVWKAPAGKESTLLGVAEPAVHITDGQNALLNALAVNSLRSSHDNRCVIWGARTLRGFDSQSEWKYVPVRRTALFIEESLYRAMQWVVFEPNDEALWAQVRLDATAFMQDLFSQGAFHGLSAREAYFVKCDHETTTANDIDLGIFNVDVGFAPLKPAEFVIIRIQQLAGTIAT